MKRFLVSLIAVALFITLSDISFALKISSAPAKTVQLKTETLSGKPAVGLEKVWVWV
jgi:hypothetical protein